jgi:ABC-type multidrug transport system ATPase subunit
MSLDATSIARAISISGEVKVLVHDVSLRVEPGGVVGVTGPSGCGKSTLLRVVMGLDARSAGEVRIDGEVVMSSALPEFRRRVAMVPQRLGLPDGTPGDVPTVASTGPWFEALGLDSEVISQTWTSLSGGEARRARIAMACAGEPDYLVLDEPTEGLDAASANRLAELVRAQATLGRGVLLVSHDEVFLARTADHVLVIYDGEVHGEGSPRDLIPAAVCEAERDA